MNKSLNRNTLRNKNEKVALSSENLYKNLRDGIRYERTLESYEDPADYIRITCGKAQLLG